MRAIPGTLQAGGAAFPNTHWSMIVASDSPDFTVPREDALTELCRDYWPPIYAFVRRRGYPAHDAQDLPLAFFAYLIETKAYARADREEGKFRTFLLVVLKRFLANANAHERRLKRGGGRQYVFLDQDLAAAERLCATTPATNSPSSEERVFDWHWAEALVGRALQTRCARKMPLAPRSRSSTSCGHS